ncbi:hypothetical protein [Aeromicrobium sp. CF3.5]|uniref:hypothetical protein n=1 Tax=Aeromicrobium sp. CF3.5 TaxID=3373078 RepID=UPI003EE72D63
MSKAIGSSVVLTLVLLAGCSGDEPESPPPTSAPSSDPSEADAVAVVEDYWAERIRVETSGAYETADFLDLVDTSLAESMTARYASLAQGNFRRVGAPELRDFSAAVTGDTAVVTVCLNEDGWGAKADVDVEDAPDRGFFASAYQLERSSGDDPWLIVESANAPDRVTC